MLKIFRRKQPAYPSPDPEDFRRVHYACGSTFFGADWLNIDLCEGHLGVDNYLCVNLTERHPFPDNSFRFGFAEDFLEHLPQGESIVFLSEACRTLSQGGVLRISFPGLEGVLAKHYQKPDFDVAKLALSEAYTMWGHHHFYSRAELEMVARHIGFSKVEFCAFGKSAHPELCGLDSRADQSALNTYAELTK